MRFLLPLAVVVLMIGVLAVGLRLDPRHVPSPLIGKPAPDFALPLLDKRQQSLGPAAFRGRPVVVNFFASWCAGCRDEHPLLMELSSLNVELIGIAYKDVASETERWLKRHGNPYRQVLVDRQGQAGLDWGVYGIPETYLLNSLGEIAYKHVGALTSDVWTQEFLPRMNQDLK